MRNIIYFFLIAMLCTSCNVKTQREKQLKESETTANFVIDTALQRSYPEVPTMSKMPENWKGEVSTAKIAFQIAYPMLSEIYGKDEIASQKPFSINLVNNKIWVIEGNLPQQKDSDISNLIFGGTAYMEIKKSNGEILKVTHGE